MGGKTSRRGTHTNRQEMILVSVRTARSDIFDFAYITIHGTPGEDGRLQGYFDMIGMPYSSCGMFVSALTFNKFACNSLSEGIRCRYCPFYTFV